MSDSNNEETFPEPNEEYIENLNILLKKLRRYRWIYYQSSDYYTNLNNKVCYYPGIVISFLITVLSLFRANDRIELATEILSYIVGVLGVTVGVLTSIQSKFQFETKIAKFNYAGLEYNRLINRLSMEIRFRLLCYFT